MTGRRDQFIGVGSPRLFHFLQPPLEPQPLPRIAGASHQFQVLTRVEKSLVDMDHYSSKSQQKKGLGLLLATQKGALYKEALAGNVLPSLMKSKGGTH